MVVTALAQVLSAPVTGLVLGGFGNTGTISDANVSPVTPAGYAFGIWGLIYFASLALAIYQALPRELSRDVHRRTGWWIASGFFCSTIWVPIFGSRTIWLSQIVIVALVACLAMATTRLTRLGEADSTTERWLLRMPVTLYLGWATLATFAGFGTTMRSLGMPRQAGWVTVLSVGLLLVAAAVCAAFIVRETAVAGFAFTACWALLAVAVATYETPVRVMALLALLAVMATLALQVRRSQRRTAVLLG